MHERSTNTQQQAEEEDRLLLSSTPTTDRILHAPILLWNGAASHKSRKPKAA
eukprot:c27946_g2_i1 orf=664-819(+)